MKRILKGLPASQGLAFGTVKVVDTLQSDCDVNADTVLVTHAARANLAPILRRAAALVCADGGSPANLLVVAREWQIPAVVGIGCAIEQLRNGMLVAVNGTTGTVVVNSMTENGSNAEQDNGQDRIYHES